MEVSQYSIHLHCLGAEADIPEMDISKPQWIKPDPLICMVRYYEVKVVEDSYSCGVWHFNKLYSHREYFTMQN